MMAEAKRNGMIGHEEMTYLTNIPNIQQKGTRLGNWLTREQAKELPAVPDRSILKSKRSSLQALFNPHIATPSRLAQIAVSTMHRHHRQPRTSA
jgi:hypothetical protein